MIGSSSTEVTGHATRVYPAAGCGHSPAPVDRRCSPERVAANPTLNPGFIHHVEHLAQPVELLADEIADRAVAPTWRDRLVAEIQ